MIAAAVFAFLLMFEPLMSQCWAQRPKIYRIGALVAGDLFLPAVDGFRRGMAELGYAEGENVTYNLQNSKGDRQAVKSLAELLVRGRLDLIVTSSTIAAVPVANLTRGTNLPVVFLSAGNPLRLVKSYGSSGNNLTGISSSSAELTGKRMQLLKHLVPGMKRIILLIDTAAIEINRKRFVVDAQRAAYKLGLEPIQLEIEARSVEEIKQKLSLIKRSLGDGLFVSPEASIIASVEDIARQAIKERLPQVGPNIETVKQGLLAAYSSNYYSLGRQGAVLADKVLRGAKPSDLPIEQPFKLHLTLNLKTARAIGLDISNDMLLQADELIQ